jgi:hypothetical protein
MHHHHIYVSTPYGRFIDTTHRNYQVQYGERAVLVSIVYSRSTSIPYCTGEMFLLEE